jgi:4-aminobutyrate aminotransferase-like enzyme/Ser/Thr protein kinase RdoA (MazF antagonist)
MHIEGILNEHYSLKEVKMSTLEGYDSINYKIESKDGVFVLKQTAFSEEINKLLDAENKILKKANTLENYDISKVINTDEGQPKVIVEENMYRLLSYVEGAFLADVNHTPELLNSLGGFLASLDLKIFSEHHSALKGKETNWDLKHFKSNYKYLEYIPNAKDRSLVDYFFLQFDEHVVPVQYQLRKGIIHNDANDWNVLTNDGLVSGIIDFGDMCHSWLINEVAIAMCYVMMNKENPLEIGLEVIKGYHEKFPLKNEEIDILYYLIAARLCTSVCNSAYAKTLKPDSDYITVSEKPAWDLLRKWIAINPIKAKNQFRKIVGLQVIAPNNKDLQLQRRSKNISNSLSMSYDNVIEMHQAAFQYMYEVEGNTFLDAYNNIMLVGHAHPKVVRAARKTMARLNTNTRYIYEELLSYSELLLSKFPKHLNKVFFVNSGSAASDLAIRMATIHTKKEKIMVLENGYHGNSKAGIEISPYKYNQKGGPGRQQHIIETQMPKTFGSGFDHEIDAANHYVKNTTEQISTHENEIAAFIAEPIVGCGGQVPLPKGYLKGVYSEIRAQGGVCISDEVQVGFGRLGDSFWGFEMLECEPDMVIIGKPMGNGHPIGAVVTTDKIATSFDNGLEFFSSFGGNPVSCAIGKAVLEVIEEEELQKHAKTVGNYLMQCLKELQTQYPQIADVRGSGLFIGVEIVDNQGNPNKKLASKIKNNLRENHILIGTDGPFDSVLKIKPPLSFSQNDVDELTHAIAAVLSGLSKV